jgi:hypothetical protein
VACGLNTRLGSTTHNRHKRRTSTGSVSTAVILRNSERDDCFALGTWTTLGSTASRNREVVRRVAGEAVEPNWTACTHTTNPLPRLIPFARTAVSARTHARTHARRQQHWQR